MSRETKSANDIPPNRQLHKIVIRSPPILTFELSFNEILPTPTHTIYRINSESVVFRAKCLCGGGGGTTIGWSMINRYKMESKDGSIRGGAMILFATVGFVPPAVWLGRIYYNIFVINNYVYIYIYFITIKRNHFFFFDYFSIVKHIWCIFLTESVKDYDC